MTDVEESGDLVGYGEYAPVVRHTAEEVTRFQGVMRRRKAVLVAVLPALFVARAFDTKGRQAAKVAGVAASNLWFYATLVVVALILVAIYRLFRCPACGLRMGLGRNAECARCGLPFK